MSKGHHQVVYHTVIDQTTHKNINQVQDNHVNNVQTTDQVNKYNNNLSGDKVGGGMLTSDNTVNSATALYKLQNLQAIPVQLQLVNLIVADGCPKYVICWDHRGLRPREYFTLSNLVKDT